jgi:hypothetical protein
MVLCKTQHGQQVMKDRSVTLSPRQRAAFILVDGKRPLAEVLRATAGAGATAEDVEQLVRLGLVARVQAIAADPVSRMDARSPQERYSAAYPIATSLTAGLGLKGFRLNLAIEGAGSYDDLVALAPKIREAVGPAKFAPLGSALGA